MSDNSIHVPHLATALSGPLTVLEQHLHDHQVAIEAWFREQWKNTSPLLYGSTDLRNAGFKIAPVDTNLFPAGFNNLNPDFMPLCVQATQATIAEICPDVTRLLLIPESHTRNIFYFENLATLQSIFQRSGFELRIGTLLGDLRKPQTYDLPSGRKITVEPLVRQDDKVGVDGFYACCIVLNNDLSAGVPEILQNVSQNFMPTLSLGWAHRQKSNHFNTYNKVADEFASAINLDPWFVSTLYEKCEQVDFMQQSGLDCVASSVDLLLAKIKEKYAHYKIEHEPFVVVKSDQGTYGMSVMSIKSSEQLLKLNRKQRNKMASSKGGAPVDKVIIQEGVHTFETIGDEHAVAEPVVYMMGRYVVGGFYRVHGNRGPDENLNAPGMNFHPLAFDEPCSLPTEDAPPYVNRFYAYGVISRLAFLAAAREAEEVK